jgi:O-antigen/teichoic acid export membrane protein
MDITTYGRIKIFQYAFSIVLIAILAYTNLMNHKTVLIAIGLSYVIVSIIYMFNNKAKRVTVVNDNLPSLNIKEIFKYALPLAFNAIVVWVLGAADQMLIDNYLDSLTLTYYSVGFRIINVIRIGVGVIMEYWPRFYFERMEKKEYSAIRMMKIIFLGFVMVLCLGTALLSKPLYIVMGASKFVDMRWMFCYLALAELFRQWGAISFTFQSFMKNTSINVIVLSILGIAKLIINWLTIKSFGVNILFYTTLGCYFLYFLISLYFGLYKEKIFINKYKNV